MIGAGGHGPVSELAEDGVRLVAVGERQRGSSRDGQMCADDAPAAEEAALDVEQVHRPAAAVGDAGVLAEELRHHRRRRAPDRERRRVVAVAREERVALLERVDRADGGGLLADREMAVAADARTGVLLLGPLLEPADECHLPEEAHRVRAVVQHRRLGYGRFRHRIGTVDGFLRYALGVATPVTVPSLGEEIASAVLIRFLVEPGAEVSRGDPLYELDTDKVTQEVEAEADGVLLAVTGTPGVDYLVGATIGWIGAPGEEPPAP